MKPSTRTSLGLAVARGNCLRMLRLKRRGQAYSVIQDDLVSLNTNLTGDPADVVGRDLRDRRARLGWQEKNWILAVPAKWMIIERVPLPEIPAADETEFLWLQAEQRLPFPVNDAAVARSRAILPDGNLLTLFAVQRERLEHLQRVFEHAGLRLTAAVPALLKAAAPAAADAGTEAILCMHLESATLQVNAGGGVLLLRSLPTSRTATAAATATALQQEIRRALAPLPATVRTKLDRVTVSDESGRSKAMAAAWSVAPERTDVPEFHVPAVPVPTVAGLAESVAAAWNGASMSPFTTHLPAQSRRAVTRRTAWLLAAVGATALAVAAVLAWQSLRLHTLRGHAAELQPYYMAAERSREQVRSLAGWLGRTPESLNILRTVAESFPEQGTVWVTRFRIRDNTDVEFAGRTTNVTDWLAMKDALLQAPGVRDVRVAYTGQTSGGGDADQSMTFEIEFRWQGDGHS